MSYDLSKSQNFNNSDRNNFLGKKNTKLIFINIFSDRKILFFKM